MSGFSSNESSNPLYSNRGSLTRYKGEAISPDEEQRLLGDQLRLTPPPSDQQARTSAGSLKIMGNQNEPLVFSTTKYNTSVERVPLWKKLVYAIGSMPYAMCNTVLGFYFSIFLLEVVILDPTYVLIIIFTGRVWDAITDPVVGFLTSMTKTRFGRLRPWLGLSMVPAGVIYFFLWFVPPIDDKPPYVKYIYYQMLYLMFQASLTCIHVPYTALTMHMSNDSKERDSVTLYRMCFEVAGTVIGIFVYTAYYLGLVTSSTQDCDSGERVPDSDERAAFRWHGLTLGILVVVFVFVTFIGIAEQKDETKVNKKIGFFKGLKETWGFKPYFYLLMLELFSWLSLQFIQGNMALYIKYSIGLESQYPYLIALLLVSSIIFMPMWQLVILKFGKKTTFYVGMWTLLPLLLSMLFIDRYPYLAYPLNFLGAMGVSCAYLVPWSMLPDVIDEATLHSNVRREELFYAFFVFGNKFGSGVTLGISTAIYKIAGYDQTVCEQPWTVALTLKLLVTIPPTIFILISFIFLNRYPITEDTRKRTKQLLMEKRIRGLSKESSADEVQDNLDSGTMSTVHVKTSNSFKATTSGPRKPFSESQTGF